MIQLNYLSIYHLENNAPVSIDLKLVPYYTNNQVFEQLTVQLRLWPF